MSADLDALAKSGSLADRRVTAYLDTLDLSMVIGILGNGELATTYAEPIYRHGEDRARRWRQGDGRPGLADDDPAVIAAIGRCAMARWRTRPVAGVSVAVTAEHPTKCGWCEYPATELQRVLDWAVWAGRLIVDEWMVWTRSGATYRRQTGRTNRYENPRWQVFATLTPSEQRRLVDAAAAASRTMLEDAPATVVTDGPGTEHAPWCDLRDDHPGDCPNPPDDTDGS
jgi:hypothetical protein